LTFFLGPHRGSAQAPSSTFFALLPAEGARYHSAMTTQHPSSPGHPGRGFPTFLSALGLVLLLALVPAAGCRSPIPNTLATHRSEKWEKDIAAFEAADRTNPPPAGCIVFVGSSSIRMWKSLATDFPGLPVVNRGFGGSQLADSANFAERIITTYKPREVVIYAGGNDINAGKDPDLVFGDFVALVKKTREGAPKAKICYISSAPNWARWAQVEKVKRLNQLAQGYCASHGLVFINVFPLMLGPDGQPMPDIFLPDRLHMNAKGYAIWKAAVEPYLK
jgi:lysophospholipase L1-like esterase